MDFTTIKKYHVSIPSVIFFSDYNLFNKYLSMCVSLYLSLE